MLRRLHEMASADILPALPRGRPPKKEASKPKPAESGVHFHEPNSVEQPTISDLLPQAINAALDNGVDYEELIHRCTSMILQIMQDRISSQRRERLKADCAGVRWTPARLRGEQKRLVEMKPNVDGTEKDGTDESEEDAID